MGLENYSSDQLEMELRKREKAAKENKITPHVAQCVPNAIEVTTALCWGKIK
ncbi:hypothetical protein LCGC14_1410480 [marine sediment metagenome]|uniref:Uncharacterized protein n=1 Tax=marine sediment metagenome TaxID=412755 RepID=A0A0F9M9U7_9ZZZZ